MFCNSSMAPKVGTKMKDKENKLANIVVRN